MENLVSTIGRVGAWLLWVTFLVLVGISGYFHGIQTFVWEAKMESTKVKGNFIEQLPPWFINMEIDIQKTETDLRDRNDSKRGEMGNDKDLKEFSNKGEKINLELTKEKEITDELETQEPGKSIFLDCWLYISKNFVELLYFLLSLILAFYILQIWSVISFEKPPSCPPPVDWKSLINETQDIIGESGEIISKLKSFMDKLKTLEKERDSK